MPIPHTTSENLLFVIVRYHDNGYSNFSYQLMIFIVNFDGSYIGNALTNLGTAWTKIEYFPKIQFLDTQGLTIEDIRHKISNTEAWAAIIANNGASNK